MIKRQFVGEINFRNQIIYVSHDKRYRYYVEVSGVETQKALNAGECVRWLLNAMHDESEPK